MNAATDARQGWSWAENLARVIPPLITPLDGGGKVDTAAFGTLVRSVLAGGCSGLFVAGGCGQGPWLTAPQRGAAVRAVVDATSSSVPVLAGVMLPASGPTCEAARQAEAEGADAVVVATPYYFGTDGDDQRRHVEAVLGAVDLPVLLYNIPQCTNTVWLPETVAALAREPRVLGIKDSSGDMPGFQRLLAIKRDRPDFRVLQGDERVMAACMLMGGDGLIAGLANVAPRLFVELAQRGAAGDAPACRRLQERITDLHTLFSHGRWLAALMAACSVLGFGDGRPAAPWIAATVEQRQAIATILQRHDLLGLAAASPR